MPENGSRLDRIEAAIENLHINIESLHASVSELYTTALQHTEQLRTNAENIRALAGIAEIHERRIPEIEGPEGPSNT